MFVCTGLLPNTGQRKSRGWDAMTAMLASVHTPECGVRKNLLLQLNVWLWFRTFSLQTFWSCVYWVQMRWSSLGHHGTVSKHLLVSTQANTGNGRSSFATVNLKANPVHVSDSLATISHGTNKTINCGLQNRARHWSACWSGSTAGGHGGFMCSGRRCTDSCTSQRWACDMHGREWNYFISMLFHLSHLVMFSAIWNATKIY